MTMLITKPNLDRPDEVYARMIAAHEGLSDHESASLNARLVLILMNHIGDDTVITEAIHLARDTAPERTTDPS